MKGSVALYTLFYIRGGSWQNGSLKLYVYMVLTFWYWFDRCARPQWLDTPVTIRLSDRYALRQAEHARDEREFNSGSEDRSGLEFEVYCNAHIHLLFVQGTPPA